jgi:hypothetical protein
MTEPEREKPDSLYVHLAGAARSRKGQRLIAVAWPWLLAGTTAIAGYVGRSMQIDPRLVAIERRLDLIASDVKATRDSMLEFQTTQKQRIVRIGRQAAYATAGFEAYEAPKVRAQKQAWAEKYAIAFERLVTQEGESPSTAYTALFKQVDVP